MAAKIRELEGMSPEKLMVRLIMLQELAITNQNELNKSVLQMNQNLKDGYMSTVNAIAGRVTSPPTGTTGQAAAANSPSNAAANPQSGQNAAVWGDIIRMMLMPPQQNNMFTELGQRMFAEMVTTNMLTNRSLIRRMHSMGTVTNEEKQMYEQMQDKMYMPLIGGGIQAGQQSMGNKDAESKAV